MSSLLFFNELQCDEEILNYEEGYKPILTITLFITNFSRENADHMQLLYHQK